MHSSIPDEAVTSSRLGGSLKVAVKGNIGSGKSTFLAYCQGKADIDVAYEPVNLNLLVYLRLSHHASRNMNALPPLMHLLPQFLGKILRGSRQMGNVFPVVCKPNHVGAVVTAIRQEDLFDGTVSIELQVCQRILHYVSRLFLCFLRRIVFMNHLPRTRRLSQ